MPALRVGCFAVLALFPWFSAEAIDTAPDRASVDAAPDVLKEVWITPRPVVRPAPQAALGGDGSQPFAVYLSANSAPEGDAPRNVAFTPDGQLLASFSRACVRLASSSTRSCGIVRRGTTSSV